MICSNPMGNILNASIHPANEQCHGKISLSHMRTFKHFRPRTGRILCNMCLLGTVIILLYLYVYSSFFSLKFNVMWLSKIEILTLCMQMANSAYNNWMILFWQIRLDISWKSSERLLSRNVKKKDKRKVQGVPQPETAALLRHQEEEETDKSKQAQIEQTYEKH